MLAKPTNRTCGQFECDMVFVLILFVQMEGSGVHLKLNVQCQGDGRILDVDGQGA